MDLSADSQAYSVHSITSAASSNVTFPLLPAETHALIDQIIHSLPNDAHTWDHVFTRYKAVLEEQDLDLPEDDETYASLLKLGMLRGATWKEKWSSAQRATHSVSNGVPSLDILKARLDSLTTRDSPRYSEDPGLSRKTPDQRKYRSVADPMTSTPSRGRILPTPVPLSETPSTIHPLKQRVTFLSPDRSDYPSSASETEAEYLSPSLRFPRHQPEPLRHSIPPDERITQADNFRSYSLLSASLDRWRIQTETHQAITFRTSLVRDRILIKRALAVWKLKLRLVEEVLVPKAEAWNAVVLGRKVLRTWSGLVRARRRRVWEGQMKQALEYVNDRRCDRIMGNVWEKWRLKAMQARADRFRAKALLLPCFYRWQNISCNIQHLNTLALEWTQQTEADLVYEALGKWHHRTAVSLAEREVVARRDDSLLRDAWSTWYHRKKKITAADSLYETKLSRAALAFWKASVQKQKCMRADAEAFEDAKTRDTAAQYLKNWQLETRANQMQRLNAGEKLARKYLQTWLIRCHTIVVELQDKGNHLEHKRNVTVARGVLRTWTDHTKAHQARLKAASIFYDENLAIRSVESWKAALSTQQFAMQKAAVARDFFVCRRVWVAWVLKAMNVRGRKLEQKRNAKVLRATFADWRTRLQKARSDDVLVTKFQHDVHQKLGQAALLTWVSRIVDIRSRAMSAAQTSDSKLLGSTFAIWRRASRRRVDDLSLCQTFIEVKTEERMRRTYQKWLRKSRWRVSARKRAEEKVARERKELLSTAFNTWRERARDNKLQRLEVLFAKAKRSLYLGEGLRVWKERTKILPALHFANQYTQRRAIQHWQIVLPVQRAFNQADEMYYRKLLGDAFSKWKYLHKARRSRRAADRFRKVGTRPLRPVSAPPVETPLARASASARILFSQHRSLATDEKRASSSRSGSEVSSAPTSRPSVSRTARVSDVRTPTRAETTMTDLRKRLAPYRASSANPNRTSNVAADLSEVTTEAEDLTSTSDVRARYGIRLAR